MQDKILNSKIFFEVLPDKDQPQKSPFSPNADLMKYAKVLDIGHKVEWVEIGDVIKLYVNTMFMIEKNKGFCSERDVIFRNSIPPKGKVHIKDQIKDTMSPLKNAKVIQSNSEDIISNDTIGYRDGQSLILPDGTEIISETQIYYTKG
jgi:hypothetical protein